MTERKENTAGQQGADIKEVSQNEEIISKFFIQDNQGDTFLHIVIAQRDEEKTHKIIDLMKEKSLDVQNASSQAALHLAVVTGQRDIVEKLVKSGANVNITDEDGNTPLILACSLGKNDILDVLFSETNRVDLEIVNFAGRTALHEAVYGGNKEATLFLLKKKVNINCQDRLIKETPLHLAVKNRDITTATLLLENNAFVNAEAQNKNTALHLAVHDDVVRSNNMTYSRDLVELLVAHGADIAAKNYQNDTPLSLAPTPLQAVLKKIHTARKNKENRKRKANPTMMKSEADKPFHGKVNQSKRKRANFDIQKGTNDESEKQPSIEFLSETTVNQSSVSMQDAPTYSTPTSSPLPDMSAETNSSSNISNFNLTRPQLNMLPMNADNGTEDHGMNVGIIDNTATYAILNNVPMGNIFQPTAVTPTNTIQREPSQGIPGYPDMSTFANTIFALSSFCNVKPADILCMLAKNQNQTK